MDWLDAIRWNDDGLVPTIAQDSVDFGREVGLFVALIATAGIAYGGWRANMERPSGGPPPAPAADPT
jgi:hypothetical protein